MAILLGVPIGVMTAVFLAEVAPKRLAAIVKPAVEPVSYTHLDVYKRQHQVRAHVDEHSFTVESCAKVIDGDLCAPLADDLLPVSYTHLDVYKRQPLC